MRSIAPLVAVVLTGCVPRLYTQDPGAGNGAWEPPVNGWDVKEPPPLVGEGFAEGEVPPDFRLQDQHGDEVSLWQFWGSVVLLDVSTMWCAPCREIAEDAQATQVEYEEEGFVYLTVLQQNVEGGPPTREDLELWAGEYGIVDAPVLADGDGAGTAGAVQFGQFPAVLVLDRRLVVRERVNPPTDEAIREAVERRL